VLLAQSTNPISEGPDDPQGGSMFPTSTSKVAAWSSETPINVIRLNIINPMKTDFLLICIHLLCFMRLLGHL
jgi:hypothetical protein